MIEGSKRTSLYLRAAFTMDAWEPVPDPQPAEEGAPATARVVLRKTYRGDTLNGTAVGHALTTQGPGGASYVAQERITGKLGDRTGSFVLEHRASMGDGREPTMDAQIVPGSGTADLAGITGTGTVEHEMLKLDVELP